MDYMLSAEQKDVRQAAREFAEKAFPPLSQTFDEEERFDLEVWKTACGLGFVGVFIPELYEGAGMGFLEHCLITEEFCRVDPGIGQTILSTTSGAEMILLFGTEAQKSTCLPSLLKGEAILSSAATEPDAGSDLTRVRTRAERQGEFYVLNGVKQFISHGTVARYLLVLCLTHPEEADQHQRHSVFLVETDRLGVEARKLNGKLGLRALETAELSFKDVRIPYDHLLGKEQEGLYQYVEFFDRHRLALAAQAVGLAQGAMERAIRHAQGRVQFGQPLSAFQATQGKLAEMATRIEAGRNLYLKAAWLADQGRPDPQLTAMAKWFAVETATRTADEALQIHGGYGYFAEYGIERFYRDAKVLEIFGGTKEMEKLMIARSLLGKTRS